MFGNVSSGRSHPLTVAVRCSAMNLVDRLGSTAFRALLCSGIGYVYMPFDARELNDELRLRSEVRRGCRRIERFLARRA